MKSLTLELLKITAGNLNFIIWHFYKYHRRVVRWKSVLIKHSNKSAIIMWKYTSHANEPVYTNIHVVYFITKFEPFYHEYVSIIYHN